MSRDVHLLLCAGFAAAVGLLFVVRYSALEAFGWPDVVAALGVSILVYAWGLLTGEAIGLDVASAREMHRAALEACRRWDSKVDAAIDRMELLEELRDDVIARQLDVESALAEVRRLERQLARTVGTARIP